MQALDERADLVHAPVLIPDHTTWSTPGSSTNRAPVMPRASRRLSSTASPARTPRSTGPSRTVWKAMLKSQAFV